MLANEFFEQKADTAGECTLLVEARKVKKGEKIIVNMGFNIETRAEENGYQVMMEGTPKFFSNAEFKKCFLPLELVGDKQLPKDAAKPVKKGEKIVVSFDGLNVQTTADEAGWLVSLPENGNQPQFMSDASFRATFNTKSAARGTSGLYQYIPQDDEKPVRYIVLDQNVTFDFKKAPYQAEAGSILLENKDDEDGYTACSAETFKKGFVITKIPEKAYAFSAVLLKDIPYKGPLKLNKPKTP